MQSDYEMAGIHHQRNRNQQPQVEQQQQQQQHRFIMENASTSSPFFPINYNHHFPPQQPNPLLQPFTQQFFQYQHLHYRSILEQQQHQDIRLELNAEGENQGVSAQFFPLSFKEDSGSKGEREEDALIRGSEGYCNEARQTSLAVSHCWQNQEDSAIKQPFWKPLCAEFSNGNNNNSNESDKNKQEEDQEMYPEEIHQQQIIKSLEENKCRVVFGELEAIYATNADNTNTTTNIHRIASESVLTAEDLPINNNNNVSFPVATFNDSNQTSGPTAIATTTAAAIDIGSESASVGEATREDEVHNKRKRRRKTKEGTSTTMARFFESLVMKLVNHQEDLQKRFMETIERLDQERKEREETWREQELAKLKKEAAVRAQERTFASNREAALVSYLEKLTGQKINFQHGSELPIKNEVKSCSSLAKLNNKRWPQAEVEALIQIKNSLESKFQEAGPKGVLWEEISNSMASMGFQRSARRCKEKWENMHKCSTVKRTKEITREQLNDGNNSIDFVTQGNDTVDDHLATVNLPEGNKGNSEKDKHGNGESKNGNWKEEMEEIKEGEI